MNSAGGQMYSGFRKYDTLLAISISYRSEKGTKREQIFNDICTVSYLFSIKPGLCVCVCVCVLHVLAMPVINLFWKCYVTV